MLSTIGPTTIARYLNFAIGRGIGEVGANELDTIIGLERVARIVKTNDPSMTWKTDSLRTDSTSDLSTTSIAEKEDPAVSLYAASTDTGGDAEDAGQSEPSYQYGAVSNKIGEAAVCWLTRWGIDVLQYEENVFSPVPPPENTSFFSGGPSTQPLGIFTQPDAPVVWRRGGLSAQWVAAVISSDVFFVKDEKERYDIARRVVELRRREGGVIDAEEARWKQLFEEGIYYSCMVSSNSFALSFSAEC